MGRTWSLIWGAKAFVSACSSARSRKRSTSSPTLPISCLTAGLQYYDGYRTERLPANLLQAQRDFFGAHTYERTDRARGEFFHTNWTGHGGDTISTTYNA